MASIESQLQYQPEHETRNRKPLSEPMSFGVAWELRFGGQNRFRVFYRVDAQQRQVRILAIATKLNNRLYLGGVEFKEMET